MALLHTLVDVTTWAHAAPGEQRLIGGALAEVAGLPDGIARPVQRIAELVREDADASTPEAVALGCGVIAEWAETEIGATRTAILFTEAAAALMPESVVFPYQIGRLLRREGRYSEAAAWLLHTSEKAADTEKPEYQVLALSGMGNLKRESGVFPEAVRYHSLALDAAREHRLHHLEGDALYDLAVMSVERGSLEEGMAFALDAITAYGPGHSQLVRMVNDLAWLWLHWYGDAEHALQLFQEIEPRVQRPAFRAVLLANITRAAAETGDRAVYELAWMEAYSYLRNQLSDEGHSAALSQLALAAMAVGQFERAHHAAQMCRSIAEHRGEARMLLLAEKILDALKDGSPADEQLRTLFPTPALKVPEASAEQHERSEEFVAAMAVALRARRDDAPLSPVRALVSGK